MPIPGDDLKEGWGVVRLTPWGSGTRVDMRSVSRIGRGDVGTNARRIRRYLDKLRAG